MKLVLLTLNLAILVFLFYRIWKRDTSSLQKFFWPALLLKLCAGIVLGLVYTYYYTVGDTFSYFEDGVNLARVARADIGAYIRFLWSGDESFSIWSELNFKQPRALFLSKITSIFCLLTSDNYWIVSLYFSGIAFSCSWLLVKKISDRYPVAMPAAVIGFLFFPSAMFWSSGLVKESLAMAALFFLSGIFLKIWNKSLPAVGEWIAAALASWILWNLKYYYLAVFLPVASTTLIVQFLLSRMLLKGLWLRVTLWCGVFFIPLLLVSILHPNFYLHRFLDVVVSSYYQFQAISNPEDLIHYQTLEATPAAIVINIPLALFSGFLRPFITEAHGILQILASIENLILLVLFLSALRGLANLKNSHHRMIFFSIIVYSVLLCIFLALSTPNFGTLSRYRVGFLPFLVFLLTIRNPLINKMMTPKMKSHLVP